jgi:hypothetical protein
MTLVWALLAAAALGAQDREGDRGRARETKGNVVKIDSSIGTIALRWTGDNPGEQTFSLARKVSVTIDGKEAKLEDLKEGMLVFVRLEGASEATAIRAEGATLGGVVESVDVAAGTVALGGERPRTMAVAPDVRVTINGRPGRLQDIDGGIRAALQLSADGSRVVSITVGRGAEGEGRRRDPAPEKEGAREVRREVSRRVTLHLSFVALDTNEDGKISREEREAYFSKLDRDGDGSLVPDEFRGPKDGEEGGERRIQRDGEREKGPADAPREGRPEGERKDGDAPREKRPEGERKDEDR